MALEARETLYVNNLNDKIKQDLLRETLYSVFTKHGKVIDLISSKGRRLRGQAWIVFDETAAATNALRQLQGQMLFEKPMSISYAKTKSDAIAKRDGTWKPREKRVREASKTSIAVAPAVPAKKKGKIQMPLVRNEPNNILFLEKLPSQCTEEMLSILFKQYHGFQEVRTVPGKADLAFVEFADEIQAGIALQGLYGFKLTPTDSLHVNFAKK